MKTQRVNISYCDLLYEKILKIKKYWHIITLILIMLLALFLRFWNFQNRYGIGYDGSRDAIVSLESARQFQLPLTGSFSSIGPITFGPWYYYYLILSNFIIPSVWAPWISIGLASFFMVFVMYKIGCIFHEKYFGIILALITSISPAQILASTQLQQHALIGFLSSSTIYLYLLHFKNTPKKHLSTLWGFIIGIAINMHYQATGLLILPFLLFILSKRKESIFFFLLGFLFSMIPLLIFELNNHWFNTRNIIDYILVGQYRVWTSNRWLSFIGKFWPEFWSYVVGTPYWISFILMLGTVFLFTIKFFQKKLSLIFGLILISFIIQVIILRYYRGEKFFGYLQFFHPYLIIFTGYPIFLLLKKIHNLSLSFLLILIYILLVFPNSIKFISVNKFNMETKQRMNTLIMNYPKTKFATYECKKVFDTDRIQGLLLFLYINRLYDDNGRKIALYNPGCTYSQGKILNNEIVDISSLTEAKIVTGGLEPITPLQIYTGTARWWFKEQP
ncbi:hypothetical protein FJY90_02400 [Candidatus Gottesmanbacteria bacterium]|nr:hypothetical protein [Candidatus Gottesmanbacteria bacterium]